MNLQSFFSPAFHPNKTQYTIWAYPEKLYSHSSIVGSVDRGKIVVWSGNCFFLFHKCPPARRTTWLDACPFTQILVLPQVYKSGVQNKIKQGYIPVNPEVTSVQSNNNFYCETIVFLIIPTAHQLPVFPLELLNR